MLKKVCILVMILGLVLGHLPAQTTTGQMTGTVTDPAGAVIPGAQVAVTNQGTNERRTTLTDNTGLYRIPQLAPGVYDISVEGQGFATQKRLNVRLEVDQSVTIDFKLGVSSSTQTVTVTGAPPTLNTTSSSLSDVVDHQAAVGLPLNGREFTQLVLLTPGSAPVGVGQQTFVIVPIGAGEVSPAVNGNVGNQNNYTMDGTLNNSLYADTWAIAPPPDAIQEFDVQSHITDAQFSTAPGANINLVTRAGTNALHGALWEFLRNDDFDAQTFPETARLPYHQNQYGAYVGGPVIVPHLIHGKNNTWFSFYWEGYRFNQTHAATEDMLTPLMRSGNFAAELGTTVIGTDCLGRPEYKDEIYDPTTSRPDPCNPGEYLRDPLMYNGELNVIPPSRINPVIPTILNAVFPVANMNVPEGSFPNYEFNNVTTIPSDVFGLRLDHQFTANDSVFLRFNRSNAHDTSGLPVNLSELSNYAQQGALGYTHIFNAKTILNFRYGYTYTNNYYANIPSGAAFDNSINFTAALPPRDGISLGPTISIANGPTGYTQDADPLGPIEGMDYHLDATRIVGSHTLGAGVMYYHVRTDDDGWADTTTFAQNGTAQDGTAGPTGYGPASFMLGVLHAYAPILGNSGADMTFNWYGYYFQDQWQATKRLVLTAGLRWDYVSPPTYHKTISAVDISTWQFVVTTPVPGYYSQANAPSGLFYPQYNGYEPRFGISYRAAENTVFHSAFALLDDHNMTLVGQSQDPRESWPSSILVNLTSLDLGVPTTYMNNLPSGASFLTTGSPFVDLGTRTHDRIPYVMEYNLGIQYQLPKSMAFELDYVGDLGRFEETGGEANTALTPGPGTVLSRVPFPQFGGPFDTFFNGGSSSYNALEASVNRTISSNLYFMANYTWQKCLSTNTDPGMNVENFYNLHQEWGPCNFSFKNMLKVSGLYALPVGTGKAFLANSHGAVQAILGNWSVGEIFTALSGQPFNSAAGADTANVGAAVGAQRGDRIYSVSPYTPKAQRTPANWLNKAGFEEPPPYTFGTEGRDDLFGPTNWDVDCNLSKTFPIHESTAIQFRAESFNVFNVTDYSNPASTVNASNFGEIVSAARNGRELQFALKVLF